MINPYQSSEVQAEKSAKTLEKFPWVRCVMAGAASWGVLFLIVQPLVSAHVINFQSGIVGAVLCSMVMPLIPVFAWLGLTERPIYFALAVFSGILLHVTFWVALQKLRRWRSR